MVRIVRNVSILVVFVAGSAYAQGVWSNQESGVTDTFMNVKAVDENIVWAVGSGGCVLRTVDGGKHWINRGTPLSDFDNVCIEPLDSATALVVSIDAASGTDFRIFKTMDGGNNWKQVFRTDHTFGDAVRFFDSKCGIALGDPYPPDYFSVYTTSDGGASWQRVERKNIPNADSVKSEFGVTACLYTLGTDAWFATAFQSKDFHPRIYHSTDLGQTWSASAPIEGLSGIAVSLEFRDRLHGVVVDNLGGKWATTSDGGKNWTVHDIGKSFWLRDVKYVPGTNSIVVAGGEPDSGYVLIREDNAGWKSIPLTLGTKRIRSVSFVSPRVGWAVGGGGQILKWIDGDMPAVPINAK